MSIEHAPERAPNHSPTRAAFSVDEFCAAHGISRVLFYKLLKAGTGPRVMKLGARTLISTEAAADFRRRMEEAAAEGTAA